VALGQATQANLTKPVQSLRSKQRFQGHRDFGFLTPARGAGRRRGPVPVPAALHAPHTGSLLRHEAPKGDQGPEPALSLPTGPPKHESLF